MTIHPHDTTLAGGSGPPADSGTQKVAGASWLRLTHADTDPLREVPAPGGILPAIPGFEIEREVGRGGMGVVYQAVDLKLRRPVAIKVVLAGQFVAPADVARFQIEAEMMARLRHPHVIQVYEFGWIDGRPYLVLEWAEGGTLAQWIKDRRLTPRDAAMLTESLARAVHAAHGQGVIHRDLKPGNVLLAGPGSLQDVAKIADFGLAKELNPTGSSATQTGLIVGTPYYMAPEQATGRSGLVGPSADVYALGAMLYELLTGRPPLAELGTLDFLAQVHLRDPEPPRRRRPELPADLESICLKCLEKDPDQRYATAEALADDLQRFLHHEAVRARPISRMARVLKWCRRHPAVASLASVLVLVVTGSLVGLSGLWRHAESQRFVAEQQRATAQAAQKRAEAVTHYLVQDMLAQGLPQRAQNRNITFEEVVLRAARRLGEAFKEQPEVEADLRSIVGMLLSDLARHEEALVHYQRVAALRRQLLGPTDPVTIAAENNVARVQAELARKGQGQARSRAELEARVEELRRLLGPEDLETTHVENQLAGLLAEQGRVQEAEELYRRLAERGRRLHGVNHRTTLGILNNYGYFLLRQERIAAAEELLREALAGMKTHLGDQDPTTITCTNNLALALQAAKKSAEAESLFRETLAARRRILGPDHPDTLTAWHNVAGTLHQQKRWAACETEYQAVLAARRRVQGPEHPDTLATAYNFAQALFAQGKHDESIPLLEDVFRVRRRDLGLTHPQTRHVLTNLVKELMNVRRFADAEPLAATLAERPADATSVESIETLDAVFMHGYCLVRLARHGPAEVAFQRCFTGRTQLLGPTHPETTQVLNELAAAQANQGKFGEAVANLEECLKRRRQHLGDRHEMTLATELNLAATLANASRFGEAESRLIAAAQAWGDDDQVPVALRQRLFQTLVQMYAKWGKPAMALPWKQKQEDLRPRR